MVEQKQINDFLEKSHNRWHTVNSLATGLHVSKKRLYIPLKAMRENHKVLYLNSKHPKRNMMCYFYKASK